MKFRYFMVSLVAVLGVFFLITPNKEVSASELTQVSERPTLEFYDENNNRIYPYSEEELDAMYKLNSLAVTKNNLTAAKSFKKYRFGSTTFTYNVWVGGGKYFNNPETIILDAKGTIKSKISIKPHNGSKFVGTVTIGKGWAGGTAIPLSHLRRGDSYKIQLKNETYATSVSLTGGEVWYK